MGIIWKNLPISPLDLHVLGTPPAFILSQDRTLWKMFIHGHSLSYWLISVLCPVSILTVLVRLVSTKLCKEFSRSNVFHCSIINVPRGFAPASAAPLIGYQTPKPLSTTFFVNFKLFHQSLYALCAFHAQGVYYHFRVIITTGIFSIFCTNFCTILYHFIAPYKSCTVYPKLFFIWTDCR